MSNWYSVTLGPMVVKKHKGDIAETVYHSAFAGMEWDNLNDQGVIAMECILAEMIKQLTDLGEAHAATKQGGGRPAQ